jgi:hypothetical protein
MSAAALAARREVLQRRCALQREQLTQAVDAVHAHLQVIDRGFGAVRRIRLLPALLALLPALLPMALSATPALRRFSRVLTLVNSLRRLIPSR